MRINKRDIRKGKSFKKIMSI